MFASTGLVRKMQVIHSGHDLGWLEEMPPRRAADELRVGYIGQISWIKGVHVLVEAFLAADLGHAARLDIHGNYDQALDYSRRLLEAQSSGDGDRITFHGSFPPPQLAKVLSEVDVLVVPSIWHENNPRVVHEAFAARVPVIASDVDGVAEFVSHGQNGLLFPRGDSTTLAQQLRHLASTPEALRQLRSGIGPVRTIEQEMDELLLLYQRLARKERSG